jgi:hypothetical protein
MNLLTRTRETHFSEPRILESRTPGVAFEMTGSAWWKPRRTEHSAVETVVREAVFRQAQEIASKRYADDVYGAQDAINADLAAPHEERSPYYSRLTAKVTLRLSSQAINKSLEYRDCVARVERLRFLKDELYSDPSMLLLDYLDRNPEKLSDLPNPARFQRLALMVAKNDQWWHRILHVLDRLSSEVSDRDGNFYAMNVLFTALQEAAPDLFNEHREQHNPDSGDSTSRQP